MNETLITLVGNVVEEPRLRETGSGHKVANFRVASTSRRWDREQERFVDNATLFINVSAWRAFAENVAASVHKGQPVIVTGRLSMRNYVVNEQPRTSYELEAVAVGHDLARGTSVFERVQRNGGSLGVATDELGRPADDSDRWHGIATEDEPGGGPDAGPGDRQRGRSDAPSEPELAAV